MTEGSVDGAGEPWRVWAERYARVVDEVKRACERARRDPASVRIVTVSKGQSIVKISGAIRAGLRVFGESRPQEFREKWSFLKDLAEIEWHFVGHLQENKVRHVVGFCELIHSVDNLRLARAIAVRAQQLGVQAPVLLQVNVSGEATKGGVAPGEVLDLSGRMAGLEGVQLSGLMTLAPHGGEEDSRWVFRHLAELAREVDGAGIAGVSMEHLSMGMTNDYRVAVEEGATIIRVGRAILGQRRK